MDIRDIRVGRFVYMPLGSSNSVKELLDGKEEVLSDLNQFNLFLDSKLDVLKDDYFKIKNKLNDIYNYNNSLCCDNDKIDLVLLYS